MLLLRAEAELSGAGEEELRHSFPGRRPRHVEDGMVWPKGTGAGSWPLLFPY